MKYPRIFFSSIIRRETKNIFDNENFINEKVDEKS